MPDLGNESIQIERFHAAVPDKMPCGCMPKLTLGSLSILVSLNTFPFSMNSPTGSCSGVNIPPFIRKTSLGFWCRYRKYFKLITLIFGGIQNNIQTALQRLQLVHHLQQRNCIHTICQGISLLAWVNNKPAFCSNILAAKMKSF